MQGAGQTPLGPLLSVARYSVDKAEGRVIQFQKWPKEDFRQSCDYPANLWRLPGAVEPTV
jgi:hypothetical protein